MDERQSSDAVLLVRPASFGFHAEAAKSNVFAHAAADPDVQSLALREFDGLAERLESAGVEVLILEDEPDPAKPDAVFPNNWVSFHGDGTMVLYPMATQARRLERDPARLTALLEARGFDVRRTVDLTGHERDGRFLEGTGSLVLDRPNRHAFASLGPRTDAAAIADYDRQLGYETFLFDARDPGGRPIYHTNVLLSLGTKFVALCLEAVAPEHRSRLIERIEVSGHTIVELSFAQLRHFGCNMIELRSRSGGPLIALSSNAKGRLTPDQVRTLENFGELIDVAIPTIEAVGGGSVRCMIAEIHLPRL